MAACVLQVLLGLASASRIPRNPGPCFPVQTCSTCSVRGPSRRPLPSAGSRQTWEGGGGVLEGAECRAQRAAAARGWPWPSGYREEGLPTGQESALGATRSHAPAAPDARHADTKKAPIVILVFGTLWSIKKCARRGREGKGRGPQGEGVLDAGGRVRKGLGKEEGE